MCYLSPAFHRLQNAAVHGYSCSGLNPQRCTASGSSPERLDLPSSRTQGCPSFLFLSDTFKPADSFFTNGSEKRPSLHRLSSNLPIRYENPVPKNNEAIYARLNGIKRVAGAKFKGLFQRLEHMYENPQLQEKTVPFAFSHLSGKRSCRHHPISACGPSAVQSRRPEFLRTNASMTPSESAKSDRSKYWALLGHEYLHVHGQRKSCPGNCVGKHNLSTPGTAAQYFINCIALFALLSVLLNGHCCLKLTQVSVL